MIKNEKSRLISGLLSMGFVADRALLGLEGVQPEKPEPHDTDVLKELSQFLSSVKQGFEDGTSTGAKPAASAWSKSIGYLDWSFIATKEKKEDDTAFVKWIDELIETTQQIINRHGVSAGRLDALRFFLQEIGSLSLSQAQSLQLRPESGKGLSRWPLIAAS